MNIKSHTQTYVPPFLMQRILKDIKQDDSVSWYNLLKD